MAARGRVKGERAQTYPLPSNAGSAVSELRVHPFDGKPHWCTGCAHPEAGLERNSLADRRCERASWYDGAERQRGCNRPLRAKRIGPAHRKTENQCGT